MRSPDTGKAISRYSIEDSSVSLLPALLLRHPHHVFQPRAFQFEHPLSQRRQFVVAAAGVVQFRCGTLLGFLDQPAADQPLQRSIKRCRPKLYRPVRSLEDFLHDAVAMLLSPNEREQNVEPVGMQRKEFPWIF